MSKKRRTEDISVNFVNRQAEGWVFGVGDCFRTQLDMNLDERINKDANKMKEATLGRKLTQSEKLKRRVWTQGDPPAYSFDRGHMFHEPPECHVLPWSEALPLLKRTITVLLAKSDAGALVESRTTDELGEEASAVIAPEADASGDGWVDYEVFTYENSTLVHREKFSRSQAAFVELLRTGK
jgi:hypothetical protein